MNAADFLHICGEGTPQEVQAALTGGMDVNTRDQYGNYTALMMAAAKNKNSEVISILVKAGAEVDARSKDGNTVLMVDAYMM